MTWTNQQDVTRTVVFDKFSHQTALGFFNNLNDITVLVKVTQGCGFNNHWWIWTGGASAGSSWNLQVRDTETNRIQGYTKPQGVFILAAKDETSFPCD